MVTRREVIVGGALAAAGAVKTSPRARGGAAAAARAAAAFLASLDAERRAKATYPLNSEELLQWHYVPMDRNGLTYNAMEPEQQRAAQALLRTGVSASGYRKTQTIRQLELVLREMENGNPSRDPGRYYFTVFGEPSADGTWSWRYEGHHVSLHWTITSGRVVASTPQFLGSNPAEVRVGPMKGTRVLAVEEDLGRSLVRSLDSAQRTEAIVSETAPGDIITAAARKAAMLENSGVSYARLTAEQQAILLNLLREYASVQSADVAARRLEAIRKDGLDGVKFAWMGGIERGQGHYYRIQSKTFLIEYDNTQDGANHIHTVWRDFNGDFGMDLLAHHYATADAGHGHDTALR